MNPEQLLEAAAKCVAEQGKLKTSTHTLVWHENQFKLIKDPIANPGLLVLRKFTFNEMQNGLSCQAWESLRHKIQTLIL